MYASGPLIQAAKYVGSSLALDVQGEFLLPYSPRMREMILGIYAVACTAGRCWNVVKGLKKVYHVRPRQLQSAMMH